MKLKKIQAVILFLVLSFVFVGASKTQAQTNSALDSSDEDTQKIILLEKIQNLQKQIGAIKSQKKINQVKDTKIKIEGIKEIKRTLFLGMSGEDVTELQEFLAQNPDFYPEGLVTGYFGPLTREAVKRLQAYWGIDTVGTFGPITRDTLNGWVKIKPTSVKLLDGLKPIGSIKKDDNNHDDGKVTICHIPPGNPEAKHTISIGEPALKAHLAQMSTVGPCEE